MFKGGYHIIIVPKNAQGTKRFHLSSLTTRILVLVAFLGLPLIAGSFFSIIYFQGKVVALNKEIAENREVLEQKELIASRLSVLERSLMSAEESLGSFQKTMDLSLGEIKTGLGPIPDEEILPLETKMAIEKPTIQDLLENSEEVDLPAIHSNLNDLSDKITGFNSQIQELYELNADKLRFMQANPTMLPVDGWVTSDFGVRHSPFRSGFKMHYGLDIASPVGTPIKAPASGRVIFADFKGGYGRALMVDHGYGVVTLYGHTSKLFVKEGDVVKKGEVIAAVGSSGSSTGPHVHYEVHVDGIPTDPMAFVVQ